MRKKVFYVIVVCLLSINLAHSQEATDFTVTDLNGEQHNLFQYLDEGKTVILDVSTTWCFPCWKVHQSHYLEYLYQTYGPAGTDELVVIFFEGDEATTMEDMLGNTESTFGNWIEGISYPIINATSISQEFKNSYVDGFPTISVICPDKSKSEIWFSAEYQEYISAIIACGNISPVQELVMTVDENTTSTCNDQTVLEVEVFSSGATFIEDFTIEAKNSFGEFIGSATVVGGVSVAEKITVDVASIALQDDVEPVTFEISGFADENKDNNFLTVDYKKPIKTSNTIHVYIESDNVVSFGNTSWFIKDSEGNIVVEGETLVDNGVYEGDHEIAEIGCYYFEITDDFDDGITGQKIEIADSDGKIIFDNNNFGSLGQGYFNVVDPTNTSNTPDWASEFSVHPTIVEDEIIVELPLQEFDHGILVITNSVGQQVQQWHIGKSEITAQTTYNLEGYAPGFYFITLALDESIVTKKIVKM